MGGGPGTSYCAVSVYVVPAAQVNAVILEKNNLVYAGGCGGMSEGRWEKNIGWRSSSVLEIAFNPTAGAANGGLELRSSAVGGDVKVEFNFQSEEGSW